jgi:hypothetical protein
VGRACWVGGAPVVLDQIALAPGLMEQPPLINSARFSNGQFIFSGSNGFAGGTYYVLSSTNPALPLSRWRLAATNTFDETGSFSVTNAVPTNAHQRFCRLRLQ